MDMETERMRPGADAPPPWKQKGALGFWAAVLALLTGKGLLTGAVCLWIINRGDPPLPLAVGAMALALVNFAAYWLLFARAGRSGWALAVPHYGAYGLFQVTWGNGWLFLIPAAMPWLLYFLLDIRPIWTLTLYLSAWGISGITFFLPGLYPFLVHMDHGTDPPLFLTVLLFFLLLILYVLTMHKLSASFERDLRMTLGLLFFGPFCALRLAWGKTEYIGPM